MSYLLGPELVPCTCLTRPLSQEKMDHLGIVALVLGTPITAVLAHTRGGIPLDLQVGLATLRDGASHHASCHCRAEEPAGKRAGPRTRA